MKSKIHRLLNLRNSLIGKATFNLLILVMFLAIIGLINCKDENSTPAPPPDTRTKTQLITDSTWKWTVSTCNVAVDKDGKDGASTDLLSQYPACFIDNVYKFKADTMFETTNVKCLTSEAAKYYGLWKFTNNEKNLQTYGMDFIPRGYVPRDYTILELTGTKMVLKYTVVVGSDTYIITDTYTH